MAAPKPPDTSRSLNTPASPGTPAGDFAEAEDELLVDGQEEVFSRAEVESGRIEHLAQAGSGGERPEAPHGGSPSRDDPPGSRDRTTVAPPAER